MTAEHEFVAILDFGSQYDQLIARRIREARVYCEILPCDVTAAELRRRRAAAIVLSGGPASVYEGDSPRGDPGILDLGIPVLGICYGMQWMCRELGGVVERGPSGEYGRAEIEVLGEEPLFAGMPERSVVWMSHGDRVASLPRGFEHLARSETNAHAAVGDPRRGLFGLQFHPEVSHTEHGRAILRHFLFDVARLHGDWRMGSFIEDRIRSIQNVVGAEGRVLCALSGGVDSAVTAALVRRAVGDRLFCVFVDNGLLRQGEREEVERAFRDRFGANLRVVDAGHVFLERLSGVTDPEEKRRVIGHAFIDVFAEEARRLEGIGYLAQGTLYPDVIESRSPRGGPSSTIKTHHNVGGLPSRLGFELVEPLRDLFKDEVRAVGRELGLPPEILSRHPFPGPGLAVRVLGAVTPERLAVVREADAIVQGEMRRAGLYDAVWQAFAVLLPVQTVGVMGDGRTYENVIAVRIVESDDGMTADWSLPPRDVLSRISNRIINSVRGVNRVVLDISSKPPSTIEWE